MLDAAKAMKLSAKDLLELEIVDEIILEPLGGAHRDRNLVLQNVKNSIIRNLEKFNQMTSEEIFEDRKNKFLKIGRNKGFIDNIENLSSLKDNKNNFDKILKSRKFLMSVIGLTLIALISLFILL